MFSIDKILIITSLDENETDTGEILAQYLNSQILHVSRPPKIEIISCDHALEFEQILNSLATTARTAGVWPFLHLEMHGDEESGLIFRNGSELSWDRVAAILRNLNEATKFNLFAVFSACFGAYLNKAMLANQPAPCYGLLAPTSTIDPGECLRFSMTFYREFLAKKDVGTALSATQANPLSDGMWLALRADEWFVTLVCHWAINHCSKASLDDRAKAVYKVLKNMRSEAGSQGLYITLGSVKNQVLKDTRKSLTGGFFSDFFMVDSLPENINRFKNVQIELIDKLKHFPIGKVLNL